MENKVPIPPKRPIIQKNISQDSQQINQSNNIYEQDKIEPAKVENQTLEGETLTNTKEKFQLNSQTKAFIIYLSAFFCIAGAIACFVLLFV